MKMMSGEQCVMITGLTLMLLFFADALGTMSKLFLLVTQLIILHSLRKLLKL